MLKPRCSLLFGLCLILLSATALAGLNPAAVATLSTGEVAVLDSVQGVFKVSPGMITQAVPSFGVFQGADLAIAPSEGGESYFVTLQVRFQSSGPFARMRRYTTAGKLTGEWLLSPSGGILAGVAIDPQHQVAYCTDSQLRKVYQLDLRSRRSSFRELGSVNEGILGPLVLDSKRGRLLVAEVQTGRILAFPLNGGRVQTIIDRGQIVEPVALALDQNLDILYVADAAKRRIWSANLAANRVKVQSFAKSVFKEPAGLAVGRDGSLWVIDRSNHALLNVTSDGAIRQKIKF